MAAVEYLDESRGPAPQAILFLHGLFGTAETWRPQLDALSPMIRCVAWTMPGYGKSRALRHMTIPALAEAAAGLLDQLSLPRAVVVGHSIGGFVAQELALTRPDRVERLVLAATTAAVGQAAAPASGGFDEDLLAAQLEPLNEGRRLVAIARQLIPTLVGPGTPLTVSDAAVKLMGTLTPAGYRAALDALPGWDARERLAGLQVPTLCLAGQLDPLAPLAAMEVLADLIPEARLEVVAHAGHLLHLEQPDEVARSIRSFIVRL